MKPSPVACDVVRALDWTKWLRHLGSEPFQHGILPILSSELYLTAMTQEDKLDPASSITIVGWNSIIFADHQAASHV
jgi:hypothetical protein